MHSCMVDIHIILITVSRGFKDAMVQGVMYAIALQRDGIQNNLLCEIHLK